MAGQPHAGCHVSLHHLCTNFTHRFTLSRAASAQIPTCRLHLHLELKVAADDPAPEEAAAEENAGGWQQCAPCPVDPTSVCVREARQHTQGSNPE